VKSSVSSENICLYDTTNPPEKQALAGKKQDSLYPWAILRQNEQKKKNNSQKSAIKTGHFSQKYAPYQNIYNLNREIS
jgi:hypothetical protein